MRAIVAHVAIEKFSRAAAVLASFLPEFPPDQLDRKLYEPNDYICPCGTTSFNKRSGRAFTQQTTVPYILM